MNKERTGLENKVELAVGIVVILNLCVGLFLLSVNTIIPIYNIPGFFFRFAVQMTIWILIVPFILHLPNGDSDIWPYFDSIGLTKVKPFRRNVIITVVGIILTMGGMALGTMVFGDWVFDLSHILPPKSDMLLTAINPGLWEEIIWRGIVLTLLLKKYSLRTSIAINTVLFALAHLINLLGGQPPIVMLGQLIFVLIATPFIALVFVKTESLIPGIIIHYSIDAFQGLFMYLLIQAGPDLIIRGLFMLAGWFAGNVLAITFLLRVTKKQDNPVLTSL